MTDQNQIKEYPDQDCPECGVVREILYYKNLPEHIKSELPSYLDELEIFFQCNNCNTIDVPWTDEDQLRDDFLHAMGVICKNCDLPKETVDIEKIPEPQKTEFKQIIKQTKSTLLYCKECNEYSFITKPQAFGF
jgi:hypothetical protein